MSKKKKKGVSPELPPPSPQFYTGVTAIRDRSADEVRRLEPQQRETSGGQLLQEPLVEVGNWISMHACAGATPQDGHHIHDALDSCSTPFRLKIIIIIILNDQRK